MEKTGGSRLLQMQRERAKKMISQQKASRNITTDNCTRTIPSRQPIWTRGEVCLKEIKSLLFKNPQNAVVHALARFQQKQMQERELKIASLYEAQQARALDRVRHSPASSNGVGSSNGSPPPHALPQQPGKVRQMFEERRTKAGIDKSYPLQPIHNTERTPPRKPLPNGYTKVTSNSHAKISMEKKSVTKTNSTVTSHTVKRQQVQKLDNRVEMVNGSGDLNHNHELDLNIKHPKSNGEMISVDEVDRAHNNYLLEDETFPEALAPTPTPRSPEPKVETKRPQKRTPPVRQSKSPVKPKPPPAVAPPRRVISENTVPESQKPRGAMQRAANSVPKRNPVPSHSGSGKARAASSAANAGSAGAGSAGAANAAAGDACAVCGRRFAPDRLPKHQEICKKAHAKKRKPFDALKHRLAGTEAEPFISKLRKAPTASSTKVSSKSMNNNWRKKHEEFIQAIRAAKQVQAHLNAGGKLSDLPPPPPSENPDYVQCPHCSRRFNQGAAERHIPKCANFQFNKPKPTSRKR